MGAKLYFKYGCVESAKTLNLLAVAHTYTQQKKTPILVKPSIDTRYGSDMVQSKSPLDPQVAHIILKSNQTIDRKLLTNIACILVDEAQFLTPHQIEDLRNITIQVNIPVICFGLRTDFLTRTFPGSKRLLELADAITEIKTTCYFCNKKAIFNGRKISKESDKITSEGDQIMLGGNDVYLPLCAACYSEKQTLPVASKNNRKIQQENISVRV